MLALIGIKLPNIVKMKDEPEHKETRFKFVSLLPVPKKNTCALQIAVLGNKNNLM